CGSARGGCPLPPGPFAPAWDEPGGAGVRRRNVEDRAARRGGHRDFEHSHAIAKVVEGGVRPQEAKVLVLGLEGEDPLERKLQHRGNPGGPDVSSDVQHYASRRIETGVAERGERVREVPL